MKNTFLKIIFFLFTLTLTFLKFGPSPVLGASDLNLIANPSMETVSTSSSSLPASWFKGGYGTNTRTLTYPVPGQDGVKAVKTEITNYTSGDAKWFFQSVPVSGGQQITFSDYYQSTVPSYVTIQYQLQDGTYKYLDIATLPAASSWTEIIKTLIVPTNYPSPVASMTIFHLIKSVGWIVTDNYNLQDITPAPTPDTGTIKVNVVVINNNDGTKGPLDFTLAVDTAGIIAGIETSFEVGAHIVSETSDPNYTTVISGDCDADGNITLNAGDNKVCTITNDDIPPVPPVPTNFIANPSVETVSPSLSSLPLAWLKGGYGVNSRTLTYNNDSQDGSKALKTEITSYTSGDAKWYFEQIPVTGGQQLTYREYYKSNISSEVDIQYQLQDGTFKYVVLSPNLPVTSTWDQVSFIFTVPTTYASPVAKMTVFHIINSVGWLSTDNYSLSTYTPPPSDPNNSILNPSVENPSGSSPSLPAFWSRTASVGSTATFTYPVIGYNNSGRAVQVNVTGYTGGSGAKWYFQSVPVSAGQDYAYYDYFKSTVPSYISVQFQLDDGSYKYLELTPLASSTNWKQAKGTFTIPLGATSLTIIHSIKEVGILTTDEFVLKKLPSGIFSSGMVSLNFDDDLESVYQNAMPILNSAGIKTSQYVITGTLGEPGFWTTSELNAVANSGHEIGAHTRTHPHLTQLDSSSLVNEIAGSKSDLVNLGYNPTTFAYPFGDYNDVVVQALKDAGFSGSRSVYSGFNTKNTDRFALNVEHVESDTTIDQIKSWIDQAISTKTWLILEIHNIDHTGVKYSTTPEVLQQIVDYINQTNVLVVDNREGLAMMNN